MRVLEFLDKNRGEGCTPYAMTLAAWRGRLNIVEWLHDNREEVENFGRSGTVGHVACQNNEVGLC